MAIELITLTPELAAELANHPHPRQRKVNPIAVKRYSNRLENGEWRDSAPSQPLLIDAKTGQLFNGLQRCSAVIATGIPMVVYIDRGSDAEEYFAVIDDGMARKAHQFIKSTRAAIRASAARVMLWYQHDFDHALGVQSNTMFSTEQITTQAEKYEAAFDRYIALAVGIYERTGLSNGVALAALTLADEAGYAEQALFFAEKVADPQGLPFTDPAWRLVDRQSKQIHRIRHRQPLEDWSILVRHLNAELLGEPMPSKINTYTKLWPMIGEDEKSFSKRAHAITSEAVRRTKAARKSTAVSSATSMAASSSGE